MTTRFDVDDSDGIATANPQEDSFFWNFNGSASEVRSIVAAVVAFWRASRPDREGDPVG